MTQQRSKLQVFFFPDHAQVREIQERSAELAQGSDSELIVKYNKMAQLGMFGPQAQCIEAVALGWALRSRFGDAIVHLKDNLVYFPCTVEIDKDGIIAKRYFSDWD